MRKLKLNKMEKMLFVLPGILLIAAFLLKAAGFPKPVNVVAWFEPEGDHLDKKMRDKVGYAKHCGTIAKFDSHAKADACMAAVFEAKRPFRMRYSGGDYDTLHEVGVVGTAQGEVFEYHCSGRKWDTDIIEEKHTNVKVITVNGQKRLNIPNHQGHPYSP